LVLYCNVLQLKPCYSRHYRPDINNFWQVVHIYLPACVGASGIVVGVDSQLLGCGLILTAGHLQATFGKVLTYCVLRPT